MRRILTTLAALSALITLTLTFPQASQAQRTSRYGSQPRRVSPINRRSTRPRLRGNKGPSVSPYLNLLDSPGRLGFQYYRRVRPERELRATNAALSRSFEQLQLKNRRRERQAQKDSELIPTGFTTSFMTHGKYFGIGQPRR